MGYNTDFQGRFELSRTLSAKEAQILETLAAERHEGREFPSFYCQWVVTSDFKGIEWDGGEKFDNYVKWLQYIIDTYLNRWKVQIHGMVEFQGEEFSDRGTLKVEKGRVIVKR